MVTNKIIFLNIVLFLLIGCKKEVSAQTSSVISDTAKTEKSKASGNINYLEKIQEKSFVVSCGGGCAMTYTATDVQKIDSNFNVKFSVEMYVNEVLSETYNETYLFVYDKSGSIDKIIPEGKKENALDTLPDGAKRSFIEFSTLMKSSGSPIQRNVAENKFIIEKLFKKTALPFSFYQYFNDDFSETKYPTYQPTTYLIDFLKNKDYDAESYKSFVIRSDADYLYLVVSVQRGDSEYYVLVTTKNNTIVDYKEIGAIGGDDPVTFKISPNFAIEKYNGNTPDAVAFEKFKINEAGKIISQ